MLRLVHAATKIQLLSSGLGYFYDHFWMAVVFRVLLSNYAITCSCPQTAFYFCWFCQLERPFKSIDKQLMAQQSCEIRKRPAGRGHQLEVAQDEHGYKRGPDLCLDRIGIPRSVLIFSFV